jgi:hypothetical protein
MIRTERVHTFIEKLFCVNCNVEMDNISLYTKTYYTYECPICKKTETYLEIYPKVVYKEI